MGSAGTGSFGDYKPGQNEDRCLENLFNITLEEVALCEYFEINKDIPPFMTQVKVKNQLHNGRVALETIERNEIIGLLPTIYSYIISCIRRGYRYEGKVTFSSTSPIAKVMVDLDAIK